MLGRSKISRGRPLEMVLVGGAVVAGSVLVAVVVLVVVLIVVVDGLVGTVEVGCGGVVVTGGGLVTVGPASTQKAADALLLQPLDALTRCGPGAAAPGTAAATEPLVAAWWAASRWPSQKNTMVHRALLSKPLNVMTKPLPGVPLGGDSEMLDRAAAGAADSAGPVSTIALTAAATVATTVTMAAMAPVAASARAVRANRMPALPYRARRPRAHRRSGADCTIRVLHLGRVNRGCP
jgi:hypothetical protein